jgi:hypothetical protein
MDKVKTQQQMMQIHDFTTYQQESRKTWNLVHTDHPIVYPTLGLVNEAGELAGKVKKIFRDKGGQIGEEERQALKYELGDVLWLFSRLERGTIRGEGDHR